MTSEAEDKLEGGGVPRLTLEILLYKIKFSREEWDPDPPPPHLLYEIILIMNFSEGGGV